MVATKKSTVHLTEKVSRRASGELDLETIHVDNWVILAEHVQTKVLKRSSDVSYLHTKAGFLIAASVIVLQIISTLEKFNNSLAIFGVISATVLAIASLCLSIASMIISKSASPLNIDDAVLQMTKAKMRREVFAKWLVDCYNLSNKEFNKVYSRKYYQQLVAACILVAAIVIIVILKGVQLYV